MLFLLRACALIFCLLFTQSAHGQDLINSIEFVADTQENHFEDYWRRVNDVLLTDDGRARLDRGQTRLSLRAMSNPVRYGLISPERARDTITAADLLCGNRDSGSLQLRCRMPNESRSRRVRLTEANCSGHPDLFTLIPAGCEHPYVMTVEGRQVTLNRLVLPSPIDAPNAPPEAVPTDTTPAERAVTNHEAEISQLRHQVSDLETDRAELRHEKLMSDHQLSRSYYALLVLIALVVMAAVIIWRQRDKLNDHAQKETDLVGQVQQLSETSARFSRTSLHAGQIRRKLEAHTNGMRAEASNLVGALLERNRALEEELLTHKSRPSVIIDESVFQDEHVAADAEARARQSEHNLREAQDVERQRLQDRIDQLLSLTEELREENASLRQDNRAQIAVHEKHQAITAKSYRDLEQRLLDTQTRLQDAEAKINEYVTANARLASERSGIDEQNRQVKLANHTLKHLLLRARQQFEGLGLDTPDFLTALPTDRLFIPTPPSTRCAPPQSHPPSNPPTEATTADIGISPMQTPIGPPGAMKTGRQTLSGMGDESALQGSARDTLRLTATASAPSPTPQPMSPHHAPTTPPPPNYLRVEATDPLDSWDIPPSPSKPPGDDARHPPLAADTGDQTGLWMMSVGTDESNAIAINLAPIPRPDPLPIIQAAPDTEPSGSSLPEQDPSSRHRPTPSIFQAPTRETSLVDSERLIARAKQTPDS